MGESLPVTCLDRKGREAGRAAFVFHGSVRLVVDQEDLYHRCFPLCSGRGFGCGRVGSGLFVQWTARLSRIGADDRFVNVGAAEGQRVATRQAGEDFSVNRGLAAMLGPSGPRGC